MSTVVLSELSPIILKTKKPKRLPMMPMRTTTAFARSRFLYPTTFGTMLSFAGTNVAAIIPMMSSKAHIFHAWVMVIGPSVNHVLCMSVAVITVPAAGTIMRADSTTRPRISSAANMSHFRGSRSASQPAIGLQSRYGRKKKKSMPDCMDELSTFAWA